MSGRVEVRCTGLGPKTTSLHLLHMHREGPTSAALIRGLGCETDDRVDHHPVRPSTQLGAINSGTCVAGVIASQVHAHHKHSE
jgi:hypothetical protein